MTNSKPVTVSYFTLPQYLGDSRTKDRNVSVAAKKSYEFFFNALQGIGVCHVLRDVLGSYSLITKTLEKYFNSPWSREQGIISLAEFSIYLV